MNKADEIRDQIRLIRYLEEEKKFTDDMISRLEDQRNRLQLEEMSIRKIITHSNQFNRESAEDEELVFEDMITADVDNSDSNYFISGTPSRPIIDCIPIDNHMNDTKTPKAVAEAIELDVSQVLLKLASGGSAPNGHMDQDQYDQEEEEEDDE